MLVSRMHTFPAERRLSPAPSADQVPVYLRMFLRFQLLRPLALARHGYETPFDALQDKTRSILTQVLAHLDYSAMARSRNAAPDPLVDSQREGEDEVDNVFVSAVRTQAMDDLKVVASEYGIRLEDLAIIGELPLEKFVLPIWSRAKPFRSIDYRPCLQGRDRKSHGLSHYSCSRESGRVSEFGS